MQKGEYGLEFFDGIFFPDQIQVKIHVAFFKKITSKKFQVKIITFECLLVLIGRLVFDLVTM